jgi:DNA modification methylase
MQDKLNKIIQADCLEYLAELPDKCVNLVLIDPPYNISHAEWDKWKCKKEYVNWLGSVFLECQRVLKDNGSFYFWHNDFPQMAELQHWISQNTRFVFNSMISWVKPSFRTNGWKNRTEKSKSRNWFNIQEYCLRYTFEDGGTGLRDVYSRKDCFTSIKEYLRNEYLKCGKTFKELNILFELASNGGGMASNILTTNKIGWTFPVEHLYKKLQTTGFFQKPYEELRAEYEELRAEYEELRPRFNIQNGQDCNNVWHSKEDNGNKSNKLHTCEKPQDLLQKIILTSSNPNDIILDCFAGSGSAAIASKTLDRNFLCCERDEKYVKIANDRLTNCQETLF